MTIALIDNYDSFTYNLYQYLTEAGANVTVYRNDKFALPQIDAFDKIVLSPGPGIPDEAGMLKPVIATYASRKPMMGVCLGEQAIGEVFGGKLTNLSHVFHGVQTTVRLTNPDPIFEGLPRELAVGRYHSWVVDKEGLPDCLEITAESEEGYIMALHHKCLPVFGIQFHPESVLTPQGRDIIANFLKI